MKYLSKISLFAAARLPTSSTAWPLNRNLQSTPVSNKDDSSKPPDGDDESEKKEAKPPVAPLPGMCCMSGCANCVYLEHAQALLEFYKGGGKEKALEIIEREVEDESLKAYLKLEIKFMKD